jgi:hypothetical protein
VVGHPGGDRPQVAHQVVVAVERPGGQQRLDCGLEVRGPPEGRFGGGEASPEEPLHRVLIFERLDPRLPRRRTGIEIDSGVVDLEPSGVGRDRSAQLELAVPFGVGAATAAGPGSELVAAVVDDRGRRAPPGKRAGAAEQHAAAARRAWLVATPAEPQGASLGADREVAQQQLPACERNLAFEQERLPRCRPAGLPAAGGWAKVGEAALADPDSCRGGIVLDDPPRPVGGDRAGDDKRGGGAVQRRAVMVALWFGVKEQPLSEQAQVELGVEGDHGRPACQNCGRMCDMDSQAVGGETVIASIREPSDFGLSGHDRR